MAITKSEFSVYIKKFQFRELFNEMGWNNDRTKQPVIVDDDAFNLSAMAEKSGFRIFICKPPSGNKIPDAATRKKIEGKVTKLFQEHLIIFIDEHRREQVWQLAVRKAGSPTKISETRYSISQDPELLYQRASGLFFTLDEEEKVTIIDVTKRVADNFQQNNERVTKRFYESFKKEHIAFLKFIEGIDSQLNMDWYTSLMLNRLMFCYFIQKKGFLDNNKNYLQDKLKACKEKKGKNKFYSFYRDFLLALFHKGLGAPEQSRRGDTGVALEIGKIPYLNGGLFDEHEIEKTFEKIEIDDKAFEKLFEFFDQYEWHLDSRESASGRDINPDVIGYIFEKYINDRAQMGAYYTKEDITDYISKNCIIPWLFDEVKRHYPQAFAADGWLWQMVKASGTDYIYDAVKYGVPENCGLFNDLPAEIQKGFAPELEKKVVDGNGSWLWELRKSWNKPAPSDIALPTEIYREVIERRKRYTDIKSKITNGEIKEINEFITYNLNIRQFAQDVIETTDDAEFIRYFYKALSGITILDPTCGSGAFLFAAMNILEPLYEACIHRMKNFIDESGRGKHKSFKESLAKVNAPEHPNLQYFIFKSIILNNLYGVDIMNEAVEIAKLRLFLKLVATVDADYRKPNLGLEPLPDVDFNIRAGNTLVGYATKKQIDDIAGLFVNDAHKKKILEQCDIVARAFARYKEIQLSIGDDYEGFKKAKDDLNARLNKLRDELDVLLHKQHYANVKFDQWLTTHQPFHWFAEFYEIIAGKGGFDVVIGNPPYVNYNKVREDYQVRGFATEPCANLYAFVMEQAFSFVHTGGRCAMIVPIASVSTDGMKELQSIYLKHAKQQWHSHYATRPGKLFVGVDMNLTITLAIADTSKGKPDVFSTIYYRWRNGQESDRDSLFQRIRYLKLDVPVLQVNPFPKLGNTIEAIVLNKLHSHAKKLRIFYSGIGTAIYYHSGGRYWRKALMEELSSHYKKIVVDHCYVTPTFCLLNSQLFYWYWITNSNCMDVVIREVAQMPVFDFTTVPIQKFERLQEQLLESYSTNYGMRQRRGEIISTDEVNFNVKESKSIIDQIDCLLAQHYGFTHEELDFIINYDIKYRMGKELDSGEAEE